MKGLEIVIVGAGKVGYNLAKALYRENDVIVIDKNGQALEDLRESIDVMTIEGDIRDPETIKGIGREKFTLIGVTDNDEVNILLPFLVESYYPLRQKIIRVNNPIYRKQELWEKVRFEKVVYPFYSTARGVAKLLRYPKANNLKPLPLTEVKLVSVTISTPQTTQILGTPQFLPVGVERQGEFHFISKWEEVEEGDLFYFLTFPELINPLLAQFNTTAPAEVTDVLVIGATPLGMEIAELLSLQEKRVVLLEKDRERAERAARQLEDVLVINTGYEDEETIRSEGLDRADLAITAFLKDEENIIKSFLAKELGIPKVITINNNLRYYSLMHKLKLSTIRGPKVHAFYEILEEIESRFLIYERLFLGAKGRIFIKETIRGGKVSPPPTGKGVIIRGRELIPIVKEETLQPNDIILLILVESWEKRWIENL
jgi:trk system potassium uptake protein TrkA